MEMIWFGLAALVFAIYVVLDGFDFGAGMLHLLVARSDRERRQVFAAIGPYWDGNEVWLLVGGGVLFLAFPKVLGAGLSGFYLAIVMFLWVLILRGISIELRSHVGDGMWRAFWDVVFALASCLAPVLLGTALGNLLRGVPLNAEGWFALPLFASFSPRGELGILDWYTALVGVLALVSVSHHGALFLVWKTDGAVRERCQRAARLLFPAVVLLWLAASSATAALFPELFRAVAERPLAWLATALFLAGLSVSFAGRRVGRDFMAFAGSGAFLLGVLAATAAAVWPTMIRATPDPVLSLTAENASSAPSALSAGLLWWPLGFVLALVYTVIVFRLHRGKAQVAEGDGH